MEGCHANSIYIPFNVTRSTVPGIEAYRSALTLDWLADEDSRQRELAHVLESNAPLLSRERAASECMASPRPSTGKVSRLMLELLKNLEGDDSLIHGLIQTLVGARLLIETLSLESEPNLELLLRTQYLMKGEPHLTLPRVLTLVWLLAADPINTKDNGWCSIQKLNNYMTATSSAQIAARMRAIDPIAARARYLVEEFVRSVALLQVKKSTPLALKDYLKNNWIVRNRSRTAPDPPTRSTLLRKTKTQRVSVTNVTEKAYMTRPVQQKMVTVTNAGYTHIRTLLLVVSLFVV